MKRKSAIQKRALTPPARLGRKGLLAEVREMILATRQTVAQGVNSALGLLYWKIGRRIRMDILQERRAGYGEKILHTLCAKLSWSHFRRIIYLDDSLKRDFYAEMCRLERWSVRTLHQRIQSMLSERTASSQKPATLLGANVLEKSHQTHTGYGFDFFKLFSPQQLATA